MGTQLANYEPLFKVQPDSKERSQTPTFEKYFDFSA